MKVVLTGQQTPISVTIAPELLEEGADSVSSAVTDAVKAAHSRSLEYMRERLGGLTSGTLRIVPRSLCIFVGVWVSCGWWFGLCQGAGHPAVTAVRCQCLLLGRLADSSFCVWCDCGFWSGGGPWLSGLVFSLIGLVAPAPLCRLRIAAAATPVRFFGVRRLSRPVRVAAEGLLGLVRKENPMSPGPASCRCPPLYHGLPQHDSSFQFPSPQLSCTWCITLYILYTRAHLRRAVCG